MDGDDVDHHALLIDRSEFLPVNLERQPLCDMPLLANRRRFDLVISLKVIAALLAVLFLAFGEV